MNNNTMPSLSAHTPTFNATVKLLPSNRVQVVCTGIKKTKSAIENWRSFHSLWINLIRINPVIKPNERSKRSFFQSRFLATKSSNVRKEIVIKTTIRTRPTNDLCKFPSFHKKIIIFQIFLAFNPIRFLFDRKRRNSCRCTNAISNMINHTARATLIRTATKDEKVSPNNKDIKPRPCFQKVIPRYFKESEGEKIPISSDMVDASGLTNSAPDTPNVRLPSLNSDSSLDFSPSVL